MDPANASAVVDDPADPTVAVPEQPNRRTAILRTGLVVGILVLVFGVILPRFIDYSEVVAAFRRLTFPQLVLMTAAVFVAWIVSGTMLAVLVPGMSPARGTQAYLILSGIGASVPMARGTWPSSGWSSVAGESGSRRRPPGWPSTASSARSARLVTPSSRSSRSLFTGGLGTRRDRAPHRVHQHRRLRDRERGPDRDRPIGPHRGPGRRTVDRRRSDWLYRTLGREDVPQVDGRHPRLPRRLGGLVRRRGLAPW